MRARAGHVPAPVAQALCRAAERAGASKAAGRRMGPAATRGEHLGDPRARREDRYPGARHARAAGVPYPGGAARRQRGQTVSPAALPQLALKLPAWRSRLLLVLLLAWFAVLAGRALFL